MSLLLLAEHARDSIDPASAHRRASFRIGLPDRCRTGHSAAMSDARLYAPAAQRNRDAILAVLERHLPKRGLVLELASGSGEHVVHFAAALPGLDFQPSDPDPDARGSIDAWAALPRLANLRPAINLDAAPDTW